MAPTVEIDGVDVTNVCVQGSWTPRLNRPAQAQVRIPMMESIADVGSRLLISNGGSPVFHGMIQLVETEGGEDTGYTVYNATDPMELWQFRPVRGDGCDFSSPTIIEDYETGPQILEAMLQNSEGANVGGCLAADCVDADAAACEGPLFLNYGTFETDGCSLLGVPTDWPMTIAELTSLMISTGCLDVVIEPTPDFTDDTFGTVSAYNGDFGNNLSTSVVFEYGEGARNIRRFRWNKDMSNMTNKLWYFMGPRILTPADPAGEDHWCYNVQGNDPGMLALDPIPNGVSVGDTSTPGTLLGDRMTSRNDYGVRMEIQIFDAGECTPTNGEPCCGGDPLTAIFRDLYRRRWQTESWIRLQPRELIHITPTRETAIGSFHIGDLVGVEINAAIRGGVSGAQRVYSYTVSWDEDSVLAISELQTSPTADG
jgi:hypothetical protein